MATPGVPTDPAVDTFSAERAAEHIAPIARVPHPMGSAEIGAVRDYIVMELSSLGLTVEQQRVDVPDYFGPAQSVEIVNVMARIRGTASSGTVVLMAHYDTVPTTPGANDDSVGVAVVLETGRAVLAGRPLSNDVILLLTDGEEPAPRYGASAFVGGHLWMSDVAFVVNLEAIGESGPAVLVETGKAQTWTTDRVAAAVDRPVAFSFLSATVEMLGGLGTDFEPFLAAGAEGVHVAHLRGSSIYHTPRDAADRVSLNSVQHHGDYTLGLARELGNTDLAAPAAPDRATFFTVFPGVLVRYPGTWALPLALLALLAAAGAAAREIRCDGHRWQSVLARAGLLVAGALGAALVASLIWMGVVAARPTMGVVEAYVYLVAFGAAGVTVRSWMARRRTGPAPAGSVVLVWAVLAVALWVANPVAAYLFTWPALAGGVALAALPVAGLVWARIRLAAVALVIAIMVVPAIDIFFAMAQPRPGNPDSHMPETIAIVALLAGLAVELVGAFAMRRATPATAAAAPVEAASCRATSAACGQAHSVRPAPSVAD